MSERRENASVELTERAARRISKILADEKSGAALRLAVNGGGCSGFQYEFAVTFARNPDDLALGAEGAQMLIDPISLEYVKGGRIDFVDDLMSQSFRVDNPNASASCGCGVSFSI